MAISKGQATAITIEVVLRRLMEKAGRGESFQDVAAFMERQLGSSLAKTVLEGATMIADLAGKLGPLKTLIGPIFNFAGFPEEESAQIAGAVLSAVGGGISEGMVEGREGIEKLAGAQFDTLTAPSGKFGGTMARLTADPKKRAVNIATYQVGSEHHDEFHTTDCPNCVERPRNGKGKSPPRFGGNIIAVARGIEVGKRPDLSPTTNNCCGPRITKIVEAARRKLMRLDELAHELHGSVEGNWYDYINSKDGSEKAFTNAELVEFNRIRSLDVWEKGEAEYLRHMIAVSVSPDGEFSGTAFINQLHGKVPAAKSTKEAIEECVDETAQAAEKFFDKATQRLEKARVELDADNDVLNEEGF